MKNTFLSFLLISLSFATLNAQKKVEDIIKNLDSKNRGLQYHSPKYLEFGRNGLSRRKKFCIVTKDLGR